MNDPIATSEFNEIRPHGSNNRSGMVLIVVVVIVMLLSLAAYKFMLAMQTEHMAAALNGDRVQARQAALSANELLSMMLEMPRQQREQLGGLADNPRLFGGDSRALLNATLAGNAMMSLESPASSDDTALELPQIGTIGYSIRSEQAGMGVAGATLNAGQGIAGAVRTSAVPSAGLSGGTSSVLGGATSGPPTRYGAVNESSKLHLLKVLQLEVAEPGAGVAALMQLPMMDAATADAILDWIDEDDEPRENGAESEFYQTLSRPYAPRNGLPPDLDELLFVKGVSPLRLYGIRTEKVAGAADLTGLPGAANASASTSQVSSGFSSLTDSNRATSNRASGNMNAGANAYQTPWIDLLTVYSGERNQGWSGKSRIFVNAKDLKELDRELSEIMPAEWAKFIILYRQLGGVSANAETSTQNDGINQVTIDLDRPGDVLIENPLDLIGTSVEVPAEDEGGDTLIVSSPFGADVTNLTPDVIDVIDLLSVVPDRRVVGRINVNEAPAEVLLALPGMTDQIVESMMSDRESQQTTSDASSIRQHPVWLLTEGFVEMAVMKQLWPHVTCGGDVYRAQIWGQAGSRAPAVRFESVLDATGKRTRAVYYRELSAPKDEIQLKAPPELVSAAAGEAGTTALE